jgi:hypothetical protein
LSCYRTFELVSNESVVITKSTSTDTSSCPNTCICWSATRPRHAGRSNQIVKTRSVETPEPRRLRALLAKALLRFQPAQHRQFGEKLDYIHRNPVTRGLCSRPSQWPWSSYIHYATGLHGVVEIESEWTANRRERAGGRLCPAVELPTQANRRLEWGTRPGSRHGYRIRPNSSIMNAPLQTTSPLSASGGMVGSLGSACFRHPPVTLLLANMLSTAAWRCSASDIRFRRLGLF